MTTGLWRFRRAYGAGPHQLVLIVCALAITAYTLRVIGIEALWNRDVWWQSIAVWFVGAAVVHDLVLFPLYAAVDRALVATFSARRGRTPAVPFINYVRVPLMACALITLLFLPGIIRQGGETYTRATGQTQEPFLKRWAILCALILLAGLIAYLARTMLARRSGDDSRRPRQPVPFVQGPGSVETTDSGTDPTRFVTSAPIHAKQPVPRGRSQWLIMGVVLLLAVMAALASRQRHRRAEP